MAAPLSRRGGETNRRCRSRSRRRPDGDASSTTECQSVSTASPTSGASSMIPSVNCVDGSSTPATVGIPASCKGVKTRMQRVVGLLDHVRRDAVPVVDYRDRHMVVECVERRGRRPAGPYVAGRIAGEAFCAGGRRCHRQRLRNDGNERIHVCAGHIGKIGVVDGLRGSAAYCAAASGSRTNDMTKSSSGFAMTHLLSYRDYCRAKARRLVTMLSRGGCGVIGAKPAPAAEGVRGLGVRGFAPLGGSACSPAVGRYRDGRPKTGSLHEHLTKLRVKPRAGEEVETPGVRRRAGRCAGSGGVGRGIC